MFREFLDKGLEKGWPEPLGKEQSQITLFKSPLIRSRGYWEENATKAHEQRPESAQWQLVATSWDQKQPIDD